MIEKGFSGAAGPAGNSRGATLVELMVTIAIVALLFGLVNWGMGRNINEQNVRAAARHLESVIKEAKLLAYEKGVSHTVIFSPDGTVYRMFRDDNGDRILDAGEPALRTVELSQGVQISNNNFTVNASGWRAVRFDSRGRPSGAGTVTFASSNGVTTMSVIVNPVGCVRIP